MNARRATGVRAARLWPGRRTLRTRVTAVAALAITAAVVVGVLFMYLLQMQSVRRTIDSQLRTYATQIEQSATNGTWPRPLASSTLDSNAEAQVIAADGKVLTATRTLAGVPAVYALPAGSNSPVRQKAADGVIPTDIRVIALRATVNGQPVTIITGTSTNLLAQVNSEFIRHLLLGLPVILIVAAGIVWLVVGRALRPVEKIRHAVTDITSADLSQRVPEPGTADEIGNLAHTMNDMLARLEAAASKQRRFVADASHELRSPLAAIRTTLEVGLAHPDRAPWPVIAERAAEQSARLEDLIQQLLLLAKADERLLAANQQLVDVAALLRAIQASVAVHHIDLDIEATSAAAPVLGNPDHLQRLLRNVVDNAIRYADSHVIIRVAADEHEVTIKVDDDGPGVPAAERERVFDRFVRLNTSRERGSGTTGLGLAIALEIARAHRGTITILQSPSGGARVLIRLPSAAGGPPAAATTLPADAEHPADDPR
jgi:signal transduction histidine kinase